jgi:alpha-galactosidase
MRPKGKAPTRPRSAAHGIRRWRPATSGLLVGAAVLLATAPGAASSQAMAQSGSRPAPAASSPAASSPAASGTLAARPYMGWTSWDTFRCNISATLIEQQALLMHQKLQRYGYRYVNIDSDCGNFVVNKYGYSVYNPSQFPGGIAPVARYVHHLGLKLGVYAVPGIPIQAVQENTPIQGTRYHAQDIIYGTTVYGNHFDNTYKIDYAKPGAQAYIDGWARYLARQGVDYLKLDGVAPGSGVPGYNTMADVKAWSLALRRTGRPIWLEISSIIDPAYASFWSKYANGWRADDDIDCYSSCPGQLTDWSKVADRFSDAVPFAPYTGPGGWTDLDSALVGNSAKDGLTATESQTVMTLWAIVRSPLYTGDDLSTLTPDGLALLTNRGVIAVDQESLPGGVPVQAGVQQQVWHAAMPHGDVAVALFNLASSAMPVTATWQDVGVCGPASVRDVWTNQELGQFADGFTATVPAHGSRLLLVYPADGFSCQPSQAASAQPSTGGR